MTTNNAVNVGLSGSTGTGNFVGSTSPVLVTPSANNFLSGFTSTATAAGTTVLTVSSNYFQVFTGTTTETVTMPVTSTLLQGQSWQIINNSTGNVTIQSSGGNTIIVLSGSTAAIVTCVSTSGTTAASWTTSFTNTGGSGIIDAWVQYTPTFTGFGTAASVNIWSRRVGGNLEIRGGFTTGTTTATEARISLGYQGTDGNVTSSSTIITATIQLAGVLVQGTNTASSFYTLIEQNKTYFTIGVQNGTNTGLVKINGNDFSNASAISINTSVPISGWS